jgi:hypothetical protein
LKSHRIKSGLHVEKSASCHLSTEDKTSTAMPKLTFSFTHVVIALNVVQNILHNLLGETLEMK